MWITPRVHRRVVASQWYKSLMRWWSNKRNGGAGNKDTSNK